MKRIVYSILIFLALLVPAYADIYFVATDGDNGAVGSEAAPWETIAYSVAQLSAGDTLNVRGGTYTAVDEITITIDGTAENLIIIQGYEGDATPVIQGAISGTDINGYTIHFNGASYITLKDLKFEECRFMVGYLGGNTTEASYIVFDGCTIENTNDLFYESLGSFVFGNSEHCTIQNCEISSTIGTGGININIFEQTNYLNIDNNYIHGGTHGIYCKHGSATGYHNYRKNFIKDVGGYYSILVNASNTLVENNICLQTTTTADRGGIQIHTNSWPSDNATINHNTIYGCMFSGIRFYEEDGQYPSDGTVTNNLVYDSGVSERIGLWTEVKSYITTSDYNLSYDPNNTTRFGGIYYTTYTLSEWQTEMGGVIDDNSINAAPTFTDGSGSMNAIDDFELASGNGYQACADGSDMGADVSLVGVDAGSETTTGNYTPGLSNCNFQ